MTLNFRGFLQPLNDPAVSTNTPSVWKLGSNIPLKFQLLDANGTQIPDSLAQAIADACPTGSGPRVSIGKLYLGGIMMAGESETSSSPTADGGVCFGYNGGTGGHFSFNLKTKTSFSTARDSYKATATVTFNGGVIASHTQENTFGLK